MTKRQMKHVWKARRVISLVLIVTLLMTGLHFDMMSDSIYAAQKNKKGKTEKQEVSAVKELTGERTENSNTYLMSDGTKKLELFGENIRYKEKGKWRDYDNTLNDIAGADEKKFSAVSENIDGINTEKYAYVNKQGDSKQYFAEVLDQEHPIVMSRDAHVIRFAPAEEEKKVQNKEKDAPSSEKKKNDTEDKNTIEVAADEKEMSASLEKDKAGDNTNKVTYSDDTQDIRYVYTSLNNGVKEEIILNKKPDKNTFTFRYDAEGTEAVEYGGNQILLADKKEGNIIASISAPYVTDAEGNISYDDVHMELKESEDSSYLVELIVEEDYLKDENNYPVTIDPTVYWDNNSGNINTSDNNPKNSRAVPGTYRFYTGINDEGYEQIAYIQLSKELEQVKGKNIHYAVFEPVIAGITGNPVIQIKNTEGNCGFMPLYQGNVPKLSQKTYGEYLCNNERQDRIALYMTDIVRAIAVGEITTYGIALKTKNTGNGNTVSFYGPEEKGNEPILYIGYSENTDVEATYDGSFDISGNGQNENSISLEWEKYDSTDVYQIYARKNEGDFKPIGITYGTDYTYTCPSDLKKIDFRILAIRKNEEQDIVNGEEDVLSNIISFDKAAGTSEDENGNEVTTVSYEQITRDTDGDGLEDGYEIWDLKTLWNTETADSTEENPVYEMDSDGDGFPDSYEVFTLGTDPAVGNPKDENGDEMDSDGDGLSDKEEYLKGTDPWLKDSDFDNTNDMADATPRKTNGHTRQTVAAAAQVHVGLYDRQYSETEDGATYIYITNIYSGVVKKMDVDYRNVSLNKTMKYFYDSKGNNTAVIEQYDKDYDPTHTQLICITYTYDKNDNVTFICDQWTKYTMSYNNSNDMVSLKVGSQNLISYADTILADNAGENEDTSELAVGDAIKSDQKVTTYGNGQTVKAVTTTYKVEDNDTASTAMLVETYYNDDDENASYKIEYNSAGSILRLIDYTQDSSSPITYNYNYTDNTTSVIRSDGFTKTVKTEKNEDVGDEETGVASTTTTTYGFKDIKDEYQTYTSSVATIMGDDESTLTMTKLFNDDTYEYSVNSENENDVINENLYSSLYEKYILKTKQTVNSNTSTTYDIDIYAEDKDIDYTYDLTGNIIKIDVKGETAYEYSYDAHGRLTDEKDYTDKKYYKYEYNETGNMQGKTIYSLDENGNRIASTKKTIKSEYNNEQWSDQLTSYNNKDITYDQSGNPLTYINEKTFTWSRGRQLSSISLPDDKEVIYRYNEDGLRTYKETRHKEVVESTDNTEEVEYRTETDTITTYEWDENVLVREKVTYNATGRTYDVWYFYDSNGNAVGYEYSYINAQNRKTSIRIYYEKDLQGNVIGLLDSRGAEIATYAYDSWGNITNTVCYEGYETAYNLNHITYRSYYRDEESGFYYLQTRYYDSEICRFINADEASYLGASGTVFAYNLYIYCENNPVNNVDYTGTLSLNSALSKVNQLLNKVVGKFGSYLKSLVKYNKSQKKLFISTTAISTSIDALIAVVTNGLIYKGIKAGMKLLLKNNKIRNSFINSMFNFFLYNQLGKVVLWTIVRIGFVIAGKSGLLGTTTSGLFKGFLSNILYCKSVALQKASSLISAFSSVGGITAFFLDLMDRKWDDYLTLRI